MSKSREFALASVEYSLLRKYCELYTRYNMALRMLTQRYMDSSIASLVDGLADERVKYAKWWERAEELELHFAALSKAQSRPLQGADLPELLAYLVEVNNTLGIALSMQATLRRQYGNVVASTNALYLAMRASAVTLGDEVRLVLRVLQDRNMNELLTRYNEQAASDDH